MSFFRTLSRALILWGKENAGDLLGSFVVPGCRRVLAVQGLALGSPWITNRALALSSLKTIDGAILGGLAPRNSGAKYTLPKGLPAPSQKVLAIENEIHEVTGFNGVIPAGYGKGMKTLLADETVAIKIGKTSFLTRMNYHFHEADVAGPHYDLAVVDLPARCRQWEMSVPRGPYKGRYAFVRTPQGVVCQTMKDRSVLLPKPDYSLKPVEMLSEIDPSQFILEHKLDGSLGNVAIHKGRAIFRSHRETGEPYLDKLPALEFLYNTSRSWIFRYIKPVADLDGTVLQGEIYHPDGVSRVSGLLNALPENAQAIQRLRGPASFYAWDITQYRGKDVRALPYRDRRRLVEEAVQEARLVNKNWHVVEKRPEGESPVDFYNRIVAQGLPWGEGIVLKPANAPAGEAWFKIKQVDLHDLPVVGFVEGTGKYAGSLGALIVENPITKARGEVGSLAISDSMRSWIWEHQQYLEGAVAKIQAQEITSRGVPRAGVFKAWHESKTLPGYPTNEYGLRMYAEGLSGGSEQETERMVYRLKSSAGWKR